MSKLAPINSKGMKKMRAWKMDEGSNPQEEARAPEDKGQMLLHLWEIFPRLDVERNWFQCHWKNYK